MKLEMEKSKEIDETTRYLHFMDSVSKDMTSVLKNCAKKNESCTCIIGVETLPDLPKDKNRKLILYCGDNTFKFHEKATKLASNYLNPN